MQRIVIPHMEQEVLVDEFGKTKDTTADEFYTENSPQELIEKELKVENRLYDSLKEVIEAAIRNNTKIIVE